ncbi:N-acetyl-gamma-glutamyl-phosphate reductase [Oikeobacillus pervagus]|uniref:N-acetyl-gamma-glutamyl-phosphate reductase n=1 Tax=Oikeobacillus pervagus TaxID=1325931 RepID=A0AAJ1WH38_9BACI|nr:N-acetyl-gamma-glutamyl-phosphate reductase [Oikeobacillus pervagus]MDQ0215792.1 N-acetyl-gamma-glutamyl-phosphate reductase [Oikeobacillus pervagus]
MKAAVIGASGYGGVELIRLLSRHPEISLHSIYSSSKDQVPVTNEYPHLHSICTLNLEKIDVEKIINEVDMVFLAVPSGVSKELSPQLLKNNTKVIDLSGDLRLKNPEDYKTWYKKAPIEQTWLDKAVYGLTEWNRETIKNATLLSNPGCYPTAALLGLAPVVQEKIIDGNHLIIDAKSGVSGAGRGLSTNIHFAEMYNNFNIYKVNQHQHIPEIQQQLVEWDQHIGPITFSAHLLPITRGIMTTIYAPLARPMTTKELHELYQSIYEKEYFVRVRSLGEFPSLKDVAGANFCDIGIDVDERTNRVTIVSTIDNLMKGAAGQAIQNANLMFGIDETCGLDSFPIYP